MKRILSESTQDLLSAGNLIDATLYDAVMQGKPLEQADVFACDFCKDCLLCSQANPSARGTASPSRRSCTKSTIG